MTGAVNQPLSELVDLLACPTCRSRLAVGAPWLKCVGCGRTFVFEGHVPRLTVGEDGLPDRPPSRVRRLREATLGSPHFYDVMQARLGGGKIAARVASELSVLGGYTTTVLDIGAGTGMVAGLVPAGARYLWLDNDVSKLRGFLARSIACDAVLGDAARLPIADDAVGWTVMVAVSHHLPDGPFRTCLTEAARVTRDRFLFVDAVRGRTMRSRVLWQLDRGRFPRTEDELLSEISLGFDVARTERFGEIHDYLLCVATPRRPKTHAASG